MGTRLSIAAEGKMETIPRTRSALATGDTRDALSATLYFFLTSGELRDLNKLGPADVFDVVLLKSRHNYHLCTLYTQIY